MQQELGLCPACCQREQQLFTDRYQQSATFRRQNPEGPVMIEFRDGKQV
jgi:hypothetical protein